LVWARIVTQGLSTLEQDLACFGIQQTISFFSRVIHKKPIGFLLMHEIGGWVKKDFAPLGSLNDISAYGSTKEFYP
jgi:hypothetical protein